MLSKESPAKTSLTRISKSTDGHIPSDLRKVPAVVKSEPLDEDEGLHYLPSPRMEKSKKKSMIRNPTPIEISSDESEAPTPRAKLAKSDNTFISDKLKKMYVQCTLYPVFFFLILEVSAPSTPRGKNKGKSAMHLSSPAVISGGESDTPVQKAKPAKGDDPFSSSEDKKLYVIFVFARFPSFPTAAQLLFFFVLLFVSARLLLALALTGTSTLCLFEPLFLPFFQCFS